MRCLSFLGTKQREGKLPADLVSAIDNVGCVFRSFREDEDGRQTPRPLAMNFLGSRPLYLDDQEAITRQLQSHYPELTDRQVKRALSMLGNRVTKMRQQSQEHADLLTSGRRRRQGWMRCTEDLAPWEL